MKKIKKDEVIYNPSLNNLTKIRRDSKDLPTDFFEQVIDLELKLAKDFNLNTLNELSNLFKNAIEYYESVGDPKFHDFSNRFNLLLKDTNLIKNMKRKSTNNSFEQNINKNFIRYKSLKVKANLNEEVNKKTVTQLIKKSSILPLSGNLIVKDLDSQSSNFKKRLNEKRMNKSTSFIIEDTVITNTLNKSSNLCGDENKSANLFVDENKSANLFLDENKSCNIFQDYTKSNNLEMNDNDLIISISEGPKGFGVNDKEQNEFSDGLSENIIEANNEKKKRQNESLLKNNNYVKEIKDKINDFLSNFNNYFNDHIFKRYTKHIENLINEKYKKHLEICNYYDGQIKEMDFIMADSETLHKNSICEIIECLKIEQKNSIDKNEETYRLLIKDSYEKFQIIGFKNNKFIKSFEQKFQMEIYHMVNRKLNPHL